SRPTGTDQSAHTPAAIANARYLREHYRLTGLPKLSAIRAELKWSFDRAHNAVKAYNDGADLVADQATSTALATTHPEPPPPPPPPTPPARPTSQPLLPHHRSRHLRPPLPGRRSTRLRHRLTGDHHARHPASPQAQPTPHHRHRW